MKTISYFFLIPLAFLFACRTDGSLPVTSTQMIQGETMGTYYKVSYLGSEITGLKTSVDSLLVALNMEVSTYIPDALISRFNHGDLHAIDAETLQGAPHFLANLKLALKIAEVTSENFNPTIMPLVNYWGFGYTSKHPVTAIDSAKVDSLMTFVGLDKIDYDSIIYSPSAIQLDKEYPGTQLDFSAIAKGYGVDLVAAYLRQLGIDNYFVDIGGEVVAKGNKGSNDSPWRVGIAIPKEDAAPTEMNVAIPLIDRAVATSGNYRNYYEVNGQKFSHTINPFTGYPERSNLLSASILAKDCATADGFATACMVLGLDAAFTLINMQPDLEGYFIYSDNEGLLHARATKGFTSLLPE
jgi:thiamine biosynthesis lipoprotein